MFLTSSNRTLSSHRHPAPRAEQRLALGTAPKAWVPTGHASSPAELAHPFPPLAATSPRPLLSRKIPSQKRAALQTSGRDTAQPRAEDVAQSPPSGASRGSGSARGSEGGVPRQQGWPPGAGGFRGCPTGFPEQQGGARAGGAARPLLNSAGNVKIISSQVKTKRARCGR